ncbi:MAG: hypothetical protein MUE52_14845 [Tabrizicola sp.]|nr:hypothetical protein [Tabrizicola sp.]
MTLGALTWLSGAAYAASPESAALGECLIGKTTGEDRLLLARWMTFAFAAHPDVQDAVTLDRSALPDTDQRVADLVMALLADRCNAEAKAAVAAEGNAAIAFEAAFQMLGTIAAEEAMRDPGVATAINGFVSHVDEAALRDALD